MEGGFVLVTPEKFSSPARHPVHPERKHIAVCVTITVADVDEALREVERAGGARYLYVPYRP